MLDRASLRRISAWVFVVGLACVHPAMAVDRTWDGRDAAWNTAAAWGGTVPTADDKVIIPNGAVQISEGIAAKGNSVQWGGSSSLNMDGGSFTNFEMYVANAASSTVHLDISGGTSFVKGNCQFGQYGTGIVQVTGGSFTIGNYGVVGRIKNTSRGELDIAGGEVVASAHSFLVGEQGDGTLTLRGTGALRITRTADSLNGFPGGLWLAYQAEGKGLVRLGTGGTLQTPRVTLCRAASTFIFDGGTLETYEGLGILDDFFVNHGGRVLVGDGDAVIDVKDTVATISANLEPETETSTGGFVKRGTGTLTLNGTNGWRGGTRVEAGSLVAPTPTSLPGYDEAGRVEVASGAMLLVGSGWTDAQIAALKANASGAGKIGRNFNAATADLTISESLDWSGLDSVTKLGDYTLFLTGHNSFGGDFLVQKGTLQADFGTGLDANHAVVLDGGSLSCASGTINATLGTEAGQIAIAPGSRAGFSARNVPLSVTLNDGNALTFGTSAFNPATLILSDLHADAKTTLANDLNLAAKSFRCCVETAEAEIAGDIAGGGAPAEFLKEGSGELVLSGNVSDAKTLGNVSGGCLRVSGTGTGIAEVLQNSNGRMVFDAGADYSLSGPLRIETGTVSVQTGATVCLNADIRIPQGTFELRGGTFTSLKNEICVGGAEDWHSGYVGNIIVYDGSFSCASNLQIGRYGHGFLTQYGGSISVGAWPCAGRLASGVGLIRHLGGTMNQTIASCGYVVGEAGVGEIDIGGTAQVTVAGNYGMYFLPNDSGKSATLVLEEGGTLSAKRFTTWSVGTNRAFRLDGGTLKTTLSTPNFIVASNLSTPATLTTLGMTTRGGVIDTDGNDVTINQPFTDLDGLIHRWSFNDGDWSDEIGGTLPTSYGFVSTNATGFSLRGGAQTSAGGVDLGAGAIPQGTAGFTIELWARHDVVKNWGRVFDVGAKGGESILVAWSSGTDGKNATLSIESGGKKYLNTAALGGFPVGTEYHIALTCTPKADGTWDMRAYRQDAVTGETLGSVLINVPAAWNRSTFKSDKFWLGRSMYATDQDAAATYNEVRVWNRPLSEDELTRSAKAGPDAHFAFRKRGAGTLTLSGANTYAVPTVVEAGTLALAANATLPVKDLALTNGATLALNATPQTVKRVLGSGTLRGGALTATEGISPDGVMTVDGTALSGVLCVTPASRLVAPTGALDISGLSLELADPTAFEDGRNYVVCSAPGGVTGSFRQTSLPKGWSVLMSATEVKVASRIGTTVIFR